MLISFLTSRTIKLSCWENSFAQRLFAVRNDKELALLRKMGFLSSCSTFLWSFTPFAVGFSTFAVYAVVTKQPVTSSIAFPALALFQLITFPLAVLPVSTRLLFWASFNLEHSLCSTERYYCLGRSIRQFSSSSGLLGCCRIANGCC